MLRASAVAAPYDARKSCTSAELIHMHMHIAPSNDSMIHDSTVISPLAQLALHRLTVSIINSADLGVTGEHAFFR